jgi:hypothetical protein
MKRQLVFTLVLVLILLASGVALAAGSYDLSWWTVDAGGGTSSGNSYTLSGTIGQPDAGTIASGGEYTLAGGFWHGGVVIPINKIKVYLPQVVR